MSKIFLEFWGVSSTSISTVTIITFKRLFKSNFPKSMDCAAEVAWECGVDSVATQFLLTRIKEMKFAIRSIAMILHIYD
jgi:hypothetical protein